MRTTEVVPAEVLVTQLETAIPPQGRVIPLKEAQRDIALKMIQEITFPAVVVTVEHQMFLPTKRQQLEEVALRQTIREVPFLVRIAETPLDRAVVVLRATVCLPVGQKARAVLQELPDLHHQGLLQLPDLQAEVVAEICKTQLVV